MNAITFHTLARTMACVGSVDLIRENRILDQNRGIRDEGIEAHSVAGLLLMGKNPIVELGREIDDEMFDAAQIYSNDVNRICDKTGGRLIIEGFVCAPSVHEKLQGVPDAYLWDSIGNTIYVWDFKYGHGYVPVFENWQLIGGAAGVLDNVNCNVDTKIILTLVQPRCYSKEGPIRRWETSRKELIPYFDRIRARCREILNDNITHWCTPSPECRHCSAAHVCEALHDASSQAINQAYENTPLELSGDSLGRELRLLELSEKLLKARIDGLKQEAVYRLRNGECVRGYHLEGGLSNAKWKFDIQTVIGMGALCGISLSKPGVLTPPQAKKLKIVDPGIIDSWTERLPVPPTIKQDDTNLTRIFK